MPQLTVADVLALIVVVGGLIGWLLKVERTMSGKAGRHELALAIENLGGKLTEHAADDTKRFDKTIERAELIVERRHLENQSALQKQDVLLANIVSKIDAQDDKAANFRHEQRNEVNELKLKLVAALPKTP